METSAPWFPVEHRATVAGGETRPTLTYCAQENIVLINWANGEISAYVPETRLALLERLLREIVEADDALRGAVDEFDAVADERKMTSAIEAARVATVKS
jgi:hypothetical protein